LKCAHFLYGSTNGRQSHGAEQTCGGRDTADEAAPIDDRHPDVSVFSHSFDYAWVEAIKNMHQKVEFYLS
jgi:hypothetical protein